MWHVALIINELENRTTCDDVANFLNQCGDDGLQLVAASGGYLLFRSSEVTPEDAFEDEPEVMYEEEEDEEPEPVHQKPTGRRRRVRKAPVRKKRRRQTRPATSDPSVRQHGSDIDPATGLPLSAVQGAVQVDPSLLRGFESTVPASAPQDANDPFGLG